MSNQDIAQDEYADEFIEEGPNGIPSEDGSAQVEESEETDEVNHVSDEDIVDNGPDNVSGPDVNEDTVNSPCGSCPSCCSSNTYSPSSAASVSENPFARVDIKTILDTINTIAPLLGGNKGSNPFDLYSNNTQTQNFVDLVQQYHSLCDGLDSIRNDRLRAICFMDRLVKFQEHFWINQSGEVESTTSDLIKRQIQSEISNVMEQLTI